jgi:hypothetical protein
MELIRSTNLWYSDYRSDKVYQAELCKIPKNNLWNINFAYGRRGSKLFEGIKNEEPLPYNKAEKIYLSLVNSKLTKGYGYAAATWVSNNRTRAYTSFASELMTEKYITEDEYSTVTRMLYSNDPETVKLAEVIIEQKEIKRWEQN